MIKPADKGGGICIMNQPDYINEMDSQLKATFKKEDGTEIPFYEKASERDLATQKGEITRLIEAGRSNSFISESDSKLMVPSGKPGRMYGLPKIHKTIPEGKRIPSCRPICSQSGSNTEFISRFVDHHAKHF